MVTSLLPFGVLRDDQLNPGTSGVVQPLLPEAFGRFVVKRMKKPENQEAFFVGSII